MNQINLSPEIMNLLKKRMEMEIERKQAFFNDLNLICQDEGIVFVGDSITEMFPIHDLIKIDKKMYNRGISAITAKEIIQNPGSQLLQLKASKIILWIGTNDLGQGASVEDVVERINQLLGIVRDCYPETPIALLSITPTNNTKEEYVLGVGVRDNQRINYINQQLKKEIAPNHKVRYIDINTNLQDNDGNLAEAYTADGLHLTIEAYQIVVETLLPFLEI